MSLDDLADEFLVPVCAPRAAHSSGTNALTEMSEWTPHHSRAILDMLHAAAEQHEHLDR